jgi:hypothetical protein
MDEAGCEKAKVFENCRYNVKSAMKVLHLKLFVMSKPDFAMLTTEQYEQ